mmetsp:Transcript_13442/g.25675  ORF Transcript_13442/g.25675 Transcript_13442/m.25675 type:complete len:207 (-) Transcript_13442:1639-2259(-)
MFMLLFLYILLDALLVFSFLVCLDCTVDFPHKHVRDHEAKGSHGHKHYGGHNAQVAQKHKPRQAPNKPTVEDQVTQSIECEIQGNTASRVECSPPPPPVLRSEDHISGHNAHLNTNECRDERHSKEKSKCIVIQMFKHGRKDEVEIHVHDPKGQEARQEHNEEWVSKNTGVLYGDFSWNLVRSHWILARLLLRSKVTPNKCQWNRH